MFVLVYFRTMQERVRAEVAAVSGGALWAQGFGATLAKTLLYAEKAAACSKDMKTLRARADRAIIRVQRLVQESSKAPNS